MIEEDEIVSIEFIGDEETIDIDVDGNHLFFANDILVHNSAMQEQEHEMHHIAGGISKINTADNVMTIYTSDVLRNRGLFKVSFIKTRSSSGVGSYIHLAINADSLRIRDPESEELLEETKNDMTGMGNKIKNELKGNQPSLSLDTTDKIANIANMIKNNNKGKDSPEDRLKKVKNFNSE